jgi:hypothetical protein
LIVGVDFANGAIAIPPASIAFLTLVDDLVSAEVAIVSCVGSTGPKKEETCKGQHGKGNSKHVHSYGTRLSSVSENQNGRQTKAAKGPIMTFHFGIEVDGNAEALVAIPVNCASTSASGSALVGVRF